MEVNDFELLSKIDLLRNDINLHHQVLNIEAIWLFVATLGCWSIDIEWVQILAAGIVFLLFFRKVFEKKSDERPWSERINEIINELESSKIDSDFVKARLYELEVIKKEQLSLKTIYRATPAFLTCYIFWMISLYYFGQSYF